MNTPGTIRQACDYLGRTPISRDVSITIVPHIPLHVRPDRDNPVYERTIRPANVCKLLQWLFRMYCLSVMNLLLAVEINNEFDHLRCELFNVIHHQEEVIIAFGDVAAAKN